MQTFLSESSFAASAKVLDDKRLQKQVVENYQIFRFLLGKILRKEDKLEGAIYEFMRKRSDVIDLAESVTKAFPNKQPVPSMTVSLIFEIYESKGFQNHPAVLMWENVIQDHYTYSMQMYGEYLDRGNNVNSAAVSHTILYYLFNRTTESFDEQMILDCQIEKTVRFTRNRFLAESKSNQLLVATHRANLYMKDKKHYKHYKNYEPLYQHIASKYSSKYYWPKFKYTPNGGLDTVGNSFFDSDECYEFLESLV